jgi:flagellar motor switch protein FliM
VERILAQEEIAELISTIRNDGIETKDDSPRADDTDTVIPLDLVQGTGIGRSPFSNLDIIFDSFSRSYSISLSSMLQNPVMVKLTEIESLEIDPFLMQLKEDGIIAIISLAPLKSGGLFVLGGALSFAIVEIMLGGSISSNFNPLSRPLTPIEQNLLRGVIEDACIDLQRAFRPLQKIKSSLESVEVNPRMVNIAGPMTEIVVARFEVTIANTSGDMVFVIPSFALEPLREKLKEGLVSVAQIQKTSWAGHMEKELSNMELEMIVQSGEVAMTIADIQKMQVGDVIELDYDINRPLRVLVDGHVKFYGMPGVSNVKKAVQITKCLDQGEYYGS